MERLLNEPIHQRRDAERAHPAREGLGMSTRRTARGRYLPSSSAFFTLGQCTTSQSLNSATVTPSTPAAPLFRTTR
jgi:hypothetical protein